jgi:hypothetical protein
MATALDLLVVMHQSEEPCLSRTDCLGAACPNLEIQHPTVRMAEAALAWFAAQVKETRAPVEEVITQASEAGEGELPTVVMLAHRMATADAALSQRLGDKSPPPANNDNLNQAVGHHSSPK